MSSEFFRVLDEGDDYQIRLTVSEFRGVEYLHIRKYYLDFSGEWLPTGDGYNFPLSISITRNLLSALLEMLSVAESKELIEDNFLDILIEATKSERVPRVSESEIL